MKKIQFRDVTLMGVMLGLSCGLAACGSSVKGIYSDATGSYVLDVKSGGAATLTFMGESAPCTYTVAGTQLALDCHGEGGKTAFTIHDDGSLTGPPGTLIPALRKTK